MKYKVTIKMEVFVNEEELIDPTFEVSDIVDFIDKHIYDYNSTTIIEKEEMKEEE